MVSLTLLNRKVAEKHYGRARQVMSKSHEPSDIYAALAILDVALKLCPHFDSALELKARALLYLRRFHDVANMLHHYIPTRTHHLQTTSCSHHSTDADTTKLITSSESDRNSPHSLHKWATPFAKLYSACSSPPVNKLVAMAFKKRKRSRLEKENWRYFLLGQACCHLGMMEDAIILLQKSKRATKSASRTKDGFVTTPSSSSSTSSSSSSSSSSSTSSSSSSYDNEESHLTRHLLSSIKYLVRRRAAAMAAMEAGLYIESARHFSKIVEGRRGIPQDFLAECYLHRAIAFQASARYIDAIVDCSRSLALNPRCPEALSARASLFEITHCFPDCLQDLQQLKIMYDSLLPRQQYCIHVTSQSPLIKSDYEGYLDYVRTKIAALRRQLGKCKPDHHMILGIPRSCSRADIERAYLLFSLKHSPDNSAEFLDRCDFVDQVRGREIVKEEATASAFRLFRIVRRSYSALLAQQKEEEEAQREEQEDCSSHRQEKPSTRFQDLSFHSLGVEKPAISSKTHGMGIAINNDIRQDRSNSTGLVKLVAGNSRGNYNNGNLFSPAKKDYSHRMHSTHEWRNPTPLPSLLNIT